MLSKYMSLVYNYVKQIVMLNNLKYRMKIATGNTIVLNNFNSKFSIHNTLECYKIFIILN